MKYKILVSFIKKHKYSYLTGILFMFVSSFVQSFFPKVLGTAIDMLRNPDFSKQKIFLQVGLMLGIALLTFAATYVWRICIIGNSRKLECTLREELYRHFQKLSPEFYRRRKTGELITYAINDIQAVRMAMGLVIGMSFNGMVLCASSIYFMLVSIDFRLTLLTLAPIPIVAFFMAVIGKKVQQRFQTVQKVFGEISDRVHENITGIRVIKSYVQEEEEIGRFEALNEKMLESNTRLVRVSSFLTPVTEACFSISFFLNLVIGGKLVLAGDLSLGDFVAFNTYLVMIMAPIVSMGRVINYFQRGSASLQRLYDIFSIKPDITDRENVIETRMQGEIEFRNLTFTYPGATRPALSNITLRIEKGTTVGIIGMTGSGKSTLASLLLKLYNPNPGELFFDGKDIHDYSTEAVRSSFGYVPQDIFMFSSTIRNNIIFFKDKYTDEDVEEASKLSRIYDSITGFPDKFATVLGERGVNLSGGQKQRLAIARAVIQDHPVLLLDDALSAVDSVTEQHLLKNVEAGSKDKTALIISHRVSAVRRADVIVVLDRGRIAEKGTHEELIKKKGLYYAIYIQQVKEKAQSALSG